MAKPKSNAFIKANKTIDMKKVDEKRDETRKHVQRLADMQKYVDLSKEKLDKLIEVITTARDENNTPILDKGVIIYVELLEVVDAVVSALRMNNIDPKVITSKVSQKKREDISHWFMENPHGNVVVFSQAGGESIDLNSTNELILYNTPRGPGKFSQTIGRICRGFGDYTSFTAREIIVQETLDEYKPILLSSRREIEQTILNSDTIPLKRNVNSFDLDVLKRIRAITLWKLGKARKPKDI